MRPRVNGDHLTMSVVTLQRFGRFTPPGPFGPPAAGAKHLHGSSAVKDMFCPIRALRLIQPQGTRSLFSVPVAVPAPTSPVSPSWATRSTSAPATHGPTLARTEPDIRGTPPFGQFLTEHPDVELHPFGDAAAAGESHGDSLPRSR